MGFSRQDYWSELPCPPPGDLSNPGIKPRFPALQADSLSSEPPGKPKNTGVGSLSLLQGIFPTQELNQGLLHWRRILNQLSYQGIELNLEDYWAWSLENRKHNQEVMAQWLHLPCIQYHMQTGTQRLLLDWRNGGVWWSIPETVVRLSRYRDYGKWVGGKKRDSR